MKFKSLFIAAIAVSTLTFVSCKKDKENPTITVNTPAEHSTHTWGSEVHLDATFADDQGLKSMEVIIGDQAGVENTDFGFHHHHDISGVSHDFHEHFTVPQNAPMMAWVHFTITDQEDKTATLAYMLHFEQ